MNGFEKARRALGYNTRNEAANAIGIAPAKYIHFEEGRWIRKKALLKRVLDFFGISLDYAYGDSVYGADRQLTPFPTRKLCTPKNKVKYRMAKIPWDFSEDQIWDAIRILDDVFSFSPVEEDEFPLERLLSRGYLEILPEGMEVLRDRTLEGSLMNQYRLSSRNGTLRSAHVYRLSNVKSEPLKKSLLAVRCAEYIREQTERPHQGQAERVLALTNGTSVSQVLQNLKPSDSIQLFPLAVSRKFYDVGYESRSLAAELHRRYPGGRDEIKVTVCTEEVTMRNALSNGVGINLLLASFGGIPSMFTGMLREHYGIDEGQLIEAGIVGDMLYWPISEDKASDKAKDIINLISTPDRPILIVGDLDFEATLNGVHKLAENGAVVCIACGESKSDIAKVALKKYCSHVFLDDELAEAILN